MLEGGWMGRKLLKMLAGDKCVELDDHVMAF